MKKLLCTILIAISFALIAFNQVPDAFKYQTIIRNSSGEILTNQSVSLRISILKGNSNGPVQYSETHSTSTNSFGLININIGDGTVVSGTSLGDVSWGDDIYFLKVETDITGGTDYQGAGVSQLLSVPYALRASSTDHMLWMEDDDDIYRDIGNVGIGTSSPVGKLEIVGEADALPEDPLFEVKNKDGYVILGVYNEGVRINVSEGAKGSRGAFAVGGFSQGKASGQEYLRVTPDSVRIYIKDSIGKGARGSFAVGGYSQNKATHKDFLHVLPDSTRVYVNGDGGFAVDNIATGAEGRYLNLTPDNYFIGHSAGSNTTTGLYNAFIGYESGYSNTTGSYNQYFGYKSGYGLTNAINNVLIGYETGINSTGGNYNVILGSRAGYNNNGDYNVFLGYETGYNNIAGADWRYGNWNTFLGYHSGRENTTGWNNTFIGCDAGLSNQTASNQTFVGNASGQNLTDGSNNVFVGQNSGLESTVCSDNVFVGANAAQDNLTGNRNTYVGSAAGLNGTTASNNVMIGRSAGYYNTTGVDNVYVGYWAGYYSTGSGNVFIGKFAGRNEYGSNKLYIENSNTTKPLIWGDFNLDRVVIDGDSLDNLSGYTFYVNGRGGGDYAWNSLSDKRLKTNITTIPDALSKVMALRGVNFTWKDSEEMDNKLQMGFIAQETESIIPEVVDNTGDRYSMQYAPVTALLVEALKEQQQLIKDLKAKNQQLEIINQDQEERINKLEEIQQEILLKVKY